MKAIFFDIDGTIYHPEIGISQNTIDEIHRVQKLAINALSQVVDQLDLFLKKSNPLVLMVLY